MKGDVEGNLISPPDDIDLEVREIWQPWLRYRCNFAVRYIVPNRINFIKIMDSMGRFSSEVILPSLRSRDKNNI